MTEQWDASLRRYKEINRRAQEEARARNDAVMADIRRRQEAAQSQHIEQPPGRGRWLLLLLLAVCVLSHRIRRGLGIAILVLGLVAVLSWVFATVIPSQDAGNIAVAAGVMGLFGTGIWMISTLGAWLVRIVATDVREELS
jgi:hypothetical protein